MDHMTDDARNWQPELPPELRLRIVDIIILTDRSTATKLMRCSRGLHDKVGESLYRDLRMDKRNAEGILEGLGPRGSTRKGELLSKTRRLTFCDYESVWAVYCLDSANRLFFPALDHLVIEVGVEIGQNEETDCRGLFECFRFKHICFTFDQEDFQWGPYWSSNFFPGRPDVIRPHGSRPESITYHLQTTEHDFSELNESADLVRYVFREGRTRFEDPDRPQFVSEEGLRSHIDYYVSAMFAPGKPAANPQDPVIEFVNIHDSLVEDGLEKIIERSTPARLRECGAEKRVKLIGMGKGERCICCGAQ